MSKLLLTGATGFIGRHCLPRLAAAGHEVHAVTSRDPAPLPADEPAAAAWHRADLLDPAQREDLLDRVRPTHLLHLAWYVAPGAWDREGADENLRWVEASLALLRGFCGRGGRRAVLAGSGTEYDWSFGYCSEQRTPARPATLYGASKNATRALLEAYAAAVGLSAAWARIFFLYGPHENPSRLVASVVRALLDRQPARCSHGRQVRDYLHVDDVAGALVALLDSEVQGTVNVASGRPVTLRQIVETIGGILDGAELLQLGAIPEAPTDAPVVVAEVERLAREVGWKPEYELEDGLRRTVEWWRGQRVADREETS